MALFIANANHQLDTLLGKIQRAHDRAVTTAAKLLDLDELDIVCIGDATMAIPEIGVGGYTPNRYLSYIYVDPKFDIDENEIYNTLCHELHHAKRYDGEGYGKTLFDSMIFEGLAVAFEEEVSGRGAFMPSQMRSRKDTAALVSKLQNHFQDHNFEHLRWFIFDNSGELPRWAGYEMGYYLVRHYLQRHPNKKASELVLEASSSFIE
jgi:uncharacterized protein YjaZ